MGMGFLITLLEVTHPKGKKAGVVFTITDSFCSHMVGGSNQILLVAGTVLNGLHNIVRGLEFRGLVQRG